MREFNTARIKGDDAGIYMENGEGEITTKQLLCRWGEGAEQRGCMLHIEKSAEGEHTRRKKTHTSKKQIFTQGDILKGFLYFIKALFPLCLLVWLRKG
jgi:hypothetical protein